jgi:hypothetical protein
MALVPIEMAVRHLKGDDYDQVDVEMKLEQASAMCLNYIEREADEQSPAWTAQTNPFTDPEFAILQAAILRMFMHLWRWRGDDEKTPLRSAYDLPDDVASLLRLLKDPSLA